MKSKTLIWLMAGILCFVVLAQGVQAAETYHYVTQWGSVGTGDGQFTAPHGIAINSSGYVYVSDPSLDQNRIQIFTDQGSFVGKWGQSGGINGRFDGPYGIAVNSSHSVYVVDHYNDRIQIFSPEGTYRGQWPVPLSPYDIAVNSAGFTYVSEDYNDRIMIFSATGTYLGSWGSTGSGNGQFQHPYGVAVDPSGNIYVSDIELNRIQKFTPNGSYLTQWGSAGAGDGQFASPHGIAVDRLENVYVADTGNNRIQKFTSNGSYLTQWGSTGAGDGQFASPQGVAVDSPGNVYVVDSGNTRIQKFARAAVTYLVENYLGNNPEGNGNQELLVSDTIVPSGTVVTLLDGTKITSPSYPTWLGFVNEAKNDNWGHPCEIVFYSDDHNAVEIQSMMPPTGIDLSHAAGKAPDAAGRTSILPPFNKDPNCVSNPAHNYALLISGGGIQSTNYARYYNDIKFLYTTLVNDYHYPKTHIRVVMSDGTSSVNDQVTYDNQNNAVPANSKPDLNGDGSNEVDYPATRANVIAALKSFSSLTTSDNLLIFTTGHGISNTANPDPTTAHASRIRSSASTCCTRSGARPDAGRARRSW